VAAVTGSRWVTSVVKSAAGLGDFLRLRALGVAGGPLSFSSSKAAQVARRRSRGLISSGRRAVRFLLAIVDSLSELSRPVPMAPSRIGGFGYGSRLAAESY